MKLIRLIAVSLTVIVFSAASGQRKFTSLEEALRSAPKLSGRGGPSDVEWINGGKQFSFTDSRGTIRLFDVNANRDSVLLDPGAFKFPGTDKPFAYESFEWSEDFRFLVFRCNVRHIWRYSGIADYYLFSTADRSLKLIATDAYTAKLSPDGSHIAFERGGNMYTMMLASGSTRQYTNDGGEHFFNGRFGWAYEEEFGLVRAWEWAPDSRHLAFWQSDERQVPIYRYTDYQGFKETFKEVPYPRVGDTNPKVRIGVVTVDKPGISWMKVECGDGYIPRIYWTADPDQLGIVQLNRKQNDMRLFFTDIKSGAARQVFEEKSEQWVELFSFPLRIDHYFYFPPKEHEFFWRSERDGWSHIYRYDYKGKLINRVTSGKWEVVKIYRTDPATRTIYYSSTEASPVEKQLYSVNYDGTGKRRISTVAGVHDADFSTDGKYFIDRFSNTSSPRQVALYRNDGQLVHRFEDNAVVQSFMKEVQYSPLEIGHFTNSEGVGIDIGIVKPADFVATSKYPVLMMVYGGPEFQDVTNSFYSDAWTQYLVQQGYVVVRVNNRGGSSYGAAFKRSVYGKLGINESTDFADAAKYICSYPWVDKERLAIYGHSYGGFMSGMTMLRFPGLFRAAIVAAPVTDYRNYDAIYTERYMGVLPEAAANYDSSSVSRRAGDLQGHMLIAHSTSDDNVHIRNTMQLVKALIDHRKDADLRLYQSGGHGISNDFGSYLLLRQQYTDFLNRWMK